MIMNKILSILKNSNKIAITYHALPDGDALGSSLALLLGLKKLGKNVYILSTDKVPPIYSFLPENNLINNAPESIQKDTDCVVVLDCGNVSRISAKISIDYRDYTLINIDHHLSNDMYGDYNFTDANASAVGEIVYQMLRFLNIDIDKEIAVCLYTSIITDSGAFKYSNTTSVTHTIAGDLINTGIDFNQIHRNIYENKKFERIKLYGKVIDNMQLVHDNKICIMELNNDMLDSLNLEASDTSDIISIGMEISDVEVALLFKENAAGTKVSLRSKSKIDVRKVAEKLGGGGHIRAAGVTLDVPINEAKRTILNILEEEFKQWTE